MSDTVFHIDKKLGVVGHAFNPFLVFRETE